MTKVQYLQMLRTKFDVSSSNSMAERQSLRLDQKDQKYYQNNYQNIRRLKILKVKYLEMLHTKFEVSRTNSMALREILRLEQKDQKYQNRLLEHQMIRDNKSTILRDVTYRI